MKKILTIIGIVFGSLLFIIFVVVFLFWLAFGGRFYFESGPQKPEKKQVEINFILKYRIHEIIKTLNDTMICEFDGFNIDEGRGKTRKWKYYYKNDHNHEIFELSSDNSNKSSKFPKIVLENIGSKKILLGTGNAEYFLGEPDDIERPQLPSIQVYDIETGYYLSFDQKKAFLDECAFEIIEWDCDPPIKNNFN